jgi:hypothetical protein
MLSSKRTKTLFALQRIKKKELGSVLAYATSFMLNGLPPAVCETVLTEVYSSVKKSISSILH